MNPSRSIKLTLFCLAMFTSLFSSFARAEDYSGADLNSWKFGAGFGALRDAYQVGLGIVSPVLINQKVERNTTALFLDGQFIYHIDAYAKGGEWSNAESQGLSAGLRMTRTMSQTIQTYTKLGADYIFWDKDFKTSGGDAQSLGLLVAIGGDFMTGAMKNWLTGESTVSMFVEAAIRLGHKRAGGISGSPDMFNGMGVVIGGRHHY